MVRLGSLLPREQAGPSSKHLPPVQSFREDGEVGMLGVILMASGCLAVCTDLKQPAFVTSLQELGRWTVITVCCAVVSITYAGCLNISLLLCPCGCSERWGKEVHVGSGIS